MIVGAACIGADMRALHFSWIHLQQAANAAVLSGAVYLPTNPALAESAARSKAHMNGIRENEIIYDSPALDRQSITMVVERSVPYRFARLFGLSQSLVIVKAVARIGSFQRASRVLLIGFQCDAHCAAYQPILIKFTQLRGAVPIDTCRPRQKNLINCYESSVCVGDAVFNPGGGNNGDGWTASVHSFAVLWITSVDTKRKINEELLDLVRSEKFLSKEKGHVALGRRYFCVSSEDRFLV
jgi:hypothetical protein